MPLIDDKLGLTGRLSSVIETDGRTIYSPFSPDKAIRIRILAGILMKMCSINDEKVSEMYIRLVFKLMLTWWCCSSTKSWLLIGQPIRDVILKTIYSLLHSPELEFPDRVLVSIVSVIFDLPIDNLVCESQGSTRSFFCGVDFELTGPMIPDTVYCESILLNQSIIFWNWWNAFRIEELI